MNAEELAEYIKENDKAFNDAMDKAKAAHKRLGEIGKKGTIKNGESDKNG